MNTFIKLSIFSGVIAIAFGVFAFVPMVNSVDTASAYTGVTGVGGIGCTDCGSTDIGTTVITTTDDGGGGGGDTPSCNANLTLNVTEVDDIGDPYRLEWDGGPATAVFFINGAEVPDSGHANFTFTGPNYDRFHMIGNNGGVECEDEVRVIRKVVEPPTCDVFTATPNTLPYGGGTVTLNWETTNATNANIDGQPVAGNSGVDGWEVNVTDSHTFVLSLSNSEGSDSCTAPVTVNPPTTDPAINIIKRDASDKDDTQMVSVGGTAHFEIIVTNTGAEDLVNVVVNDPLESACNLTIGNLAIGASHTYTCNSTNVQSAFTNVANVTGKSSVDGTIVTDSDPTHVTMRSTIGISCKNNATFTASNYNLPRGGGDVTLNWTTTGVDAISINGVASTKLNDSEKVRVNSDTTYTLTLYKNGSVADRCPLSIDVASGGGGGGGGSIRPRCEFEASDEKVSVGEEVTLSWKTRFGRDLTIYEGSEKRGEKIFETDDDDLVDDGSLKVRPTKDTTYTLIVERGSQERKCEVDIDVKGGVVLTSKRVQGQVAGITLTQVPYTGFDAGPMLTFIFYAVLAIWGIFVAYLLVVRKDTVMGMSLAGAHPRGRIIRDDFSTDASLTEPEATEAAAYVGSVLAPQTVATKDTQMTVPTNLPTGDVQVGYAAAETEVDSESEEAREMKELEDEAHENRVLLSSDAIRHFIAAHPNTDARIGALKQVIGEAKTSFPSEDGWTVLNLDRLQSLMEAPEAAEVPVGTGSLAEAILAGNIAAAYQMIGHRPMVALADAAADLDTVYRGRQGEQVVVSDMLARESARLETAQITAAIAALTSALDGTYESEAEAVKMAILKATKATS